MNTEGIVGGWSLVGVSLDKPCVVANHRLPAVISKQSAATVHANPDVACSVLGKGAHQPISFRNLFKPGDCLLLGIPSHQPIPGPLSRGPDAALRVLEDLEHQHVLCVTHLRLLPRQACRRHRCVTAKPSVGCRPPLTGVALQQDLVISPGWALAKNLGYYGVKLNSIEGVHRPAVSSFRKGHRQNCPGAI